MLLTTAALIYGFSTSVLAAVVPEGVKLSETQTLTVGNFSEPFSIDPNMSQTTEDFRIQRDLFEGLVIQGDEGGTIPGQAESWTISPDYKTFTFTIRDNAAWSNGDKVTAHDFVNSWRRFVSPETASPYSWYMEMTRINNASDIVNGRKSPESLGVKALDDSTLEIKLDQSTPFFLTMLTLPVMSPVHMPSVERWGREWTQAGKIVTNGAFTIQDWIVNERITLKRNTWYWDNKNTVLDTVNILPVTGNPELNRYKAGDIHITKGIPVEHYKAMLEERPDEVTQISGISNYYYIFNMEVKPFDDVRVRKALSYAVDREIITEKVLGQGQQPEYTFSPPSVYGYTPPVVDYQQWTQKQRDQKARELLEAAGYNKNNPLKVELLYNTSEGHKRLAVAVSQMWKKLGVKTTLKNEEWKAMLDTKLRGDFEIVRAGWTADYNEASSMLDVMLSFNGQNSGRYVSPDYDELMKEAKLAPTDEQRNILYAEADNLLAQDMPVLPMYFAGNVFLKDVSVGGYPMKNPQNIVYSKNLYRIKN